MEILLWPLGTSLGQPSQESQVHDGIDHVSCFLVNGTLQRPPTRPKDGTRAFRAGWACIELIQSAPVRVPLLQTSENRAVRRASVFCPVSCGSRSRVHRATGTLATRAQGHLRPPLDPGRRPLPSQCQEHACFARWGSEKATLAVCFHVGKRRGRARAWGVSCGPTNSYTVAQDP